MNEPLVRAVDVSRTYRSGDTQVAALTHATCEIHSGERIALTGPSGSGKSTLLQLLAGIDHPSTGTIAWPALNGSLALRPAKIGFVFQTPSLLAPLSAIENVEVPLLINRMGSTRARQRALEALEVVGLAAIADKLPEELSGGQAARVGFARALASRPALLLADEPTGQLDRPTADHLFDTVLEWLRSTQAALVVATHDQHVAQRLPTCWSIERGHLRRDCS